jgi:hypothetical protein
MTGGPSQCLLALALSSGFLRALGDEGNAVGSMDCTRMSGARDCRGQFPEHEGFVRCQH